MTFLRFLLIIANAAASLILLAIPVGKLFGVIEDAIDAALIFIWLMYFVALLTSAIGLWGIHSSRPALIRPFIMIAMPGSFVMAFVSVYTTLNAPSSFMQIGIAAGILLGLNVMILWGPFKAQLESTANREP